MIINGKVCTDITLYDADGIEIAEIYDYFAMGVLEKVSDFEYIEQATGRKIVIHKCPRAEKRERQKREAIEVLVPALAAAATTLLLRVLLMLLR